MMLNTELLPASLAAHIPGRVYFILNCFVGDHLVVVVLTKPPLVKLRLETVPLVFVFLPIHTRRLIKVVNISESVNSQLFHVGSHICVAMLHRVKLVTSLPLSFFQRAYLQIAHEFLRA